MGNAEGGTRTPTSYLTRPSNVRVCQFRHFGSSCQIAITERHFAVSFFSRQRNQPSIQYYLVFFSGDFFASGLAAGEAVFSAATGLVVAAAGDAAAGAVDAAGEGEGTGDDAGTVVDCKTECEPVRAGCERASAIKRNEKAAPIVIRTRMLAVPRGPNAVLETLLVNSAPASDLPGCSRITTISTPHERINSAYKM